MCKHVTAEAEQGPREGICVWSCVQEVMGHQNYCHGMPDSFSPKSKSFPTGLQCPLENISPVGCICSPFGLQVPSATGDYINVPMVELELQICEWQREEGSVSH